MDSRLKLALVAIIIILFKGSDKLLHLLTVIHIKRAKPLITNTGQASNDLIKDFEKEITGAFNLFSKLLTEQMDFEMEKSGVKVFLKPGSDAINTFKGIGKFDRTYSLQEIISVIKSPYARKEWDGRYANGTIIEMCGNSFITHSTQKGTFPFAAREFSTIGRIAINDNHASVVSTSITHAKIAYDNSKVLANLYLAGWDIKKNGEKLEITYVVQVDIRGTIPSCTLLVLNSIALLKLIQTQSPLCVAAVVKYLDDNGPLPFVIQHDANSQDGIQIVKEEFNKSYNLAIKNESSKLKSVLIALPSKRFKGAKIEVSGSDSCKLDENDSKMISSAIEYILVVTILPSKKVDIHISPQPQGFIINKSNVSQGAQKLKVSTGESIKVVSLLSPTLESADLMLEKVDKSWDCVVDTVAGSINQSTNYLRRSAFKIADLAKIILFH